MISHFIPRIKKKIHDLGEIYTLIDWLVHMNLIKKTMDIGPMDKIKGSTHFSLG